MAHEPMQGASCACDASAMQRFAAARNAMHASARRGVAVAADAVRVKACAQVVQHRLTWVVLEQ